MKLHLNGMLKHAVESWPNEVCAFLFSNGPYSSDEEWHAFIVKNASDDPENRWIPDRKEMLTVKAKAIKLGLTKIGNIHSHPVQGDYDWRGEYLLPSDDDLKFARRFNDTIRGIMAVDENGVLGFRFHDKFGRVVDIDIEKVET